MNDVDQFIGGDHRVMDTGLMAVKEARFEQRLHVISSMVEHRNEARPHKGSALSLDGDNRALVANEAIA